MCSVRTYFCQPSLLPSNHQSKTTEGIFGQLCLQLRHNRTHHQGYNIAGVCVYGILLNITCWASATTMPMQKGKTAIFSADGKNFSRSIYGNVATAKTYTSYYVWCQLSVHKFRINIHICSIRFQFISNFMTMDIAPYTKHIGSEHVLAKVVQNENQIGSLLPQPVTDLWNRQKGKNTCLPMSMVKNSA